MEHATPMALIIQLIFGLSIVGFVLVARSGRQLFVRRLPGIDAMEQAVGRATEMGRPICFVPGIGGLDIVTLQALSVASWAARDAAQYRVRLILPTRDPIIFALSQQLIRESYAQAGNADAFNPDDVRFLSPSQFAFASGVVGLMNRERVAANFFFGSFFAESLILAETGQQLGAIQVAGTPELLQIPFFICACDYTIIAEEYYATSAYLTREPTLLGSLVGQDWCKIILFGIVLIGVGLYTFHPSWGETFARWFGG